jgi:hypothetical protein
MISSCALEVRPGQSKTLARMRHLAPDFINGRSGRPLRSWCVLGGIERADNCSEISLFSKWRLQVKSLIERFRSIYVFNKRT